MSFYEAQGTLVLITGVSKVQMSLGKQLTCRMRRRKYIQYNTCMYMYIRTYRAQNTLYVDMT